MSINSWTRPLQCVILGGGISGMTCAYFLNKFCIPGSINIRVLEKNDRLGGWIDTQQVAIDGIDREHLFFVGARTASLWDSSAAILLSIAYELGMAKDVLVAHKESVGANDRYLFFNNKLVDIPCRPSLTNLPYILSPYPMEKPYTFGYYLRMVSGLYKLGRLRSDSHIEEYVMKDIDQKTLDDVFRQAFSDDIIKYTLEPMVQGICGCKTNELAATVFFREFGPRLFKKSFKLHNFSPFYKPPQSTFELPYHDKIANYKEDISLKLYHAGVNDERQAIDYRLYQFLYYNGFELWSLKYGFYSLIEEIASYLSQSTNYSSIELNTDVTRIGFSNIDVRRYYSRHLKDRKKGSIMQPLKDTALEITTNGADIIDADIIISSLPLYQLKKIVPKNNLHCMIPSLGFSSHVTMSVVYLKKLFTKPITGFGFLVPYDQQTNLPVSGCIFNNGIMSHCYSCAEIHPIIDETTTPTYGFTFIMRHETLLENDVDPYNENQVFKVMQKAMKILFNIEENPVAHSYNMCYKALPMFPPSYLKNYELFEDKLQENMPHLHLIGGCKGVYSINSLAIVSLQKAFEIACNNNILNNSYNTPLE